MISELRPSAASACAAAIGFLRLDRESIRLHRISESRSAAEPLAGRLRPPHPTHGPEPEQRDQAEGDEVSGEGSRPRGRPAGRDWC